MAISNSLPRSISRMISRRNDRIVGLDALRAFAIIGITLFHMFPMTVRGGYLGVSLFFVLTGYLLAYTSERAHARDCFSLFGYYKKRILRIYPSLILVILTTIGAYHFLAPMAVGSIHKEVMSVLLGYNNWWQIGQNADYFARMANVSPFTHLWFIGIVLQFYLIFPVIFGIYIVGRKLVGRRFGILLILMLGAASAALMPYFYYQNFDITRLYYGTDTRIYAILFGVVLGLIHAGSYHRRVYKPLAWLGVFLAFGISAAAYIFLDGENPIVYRGSMLALTLPFLLLVAVIGNPSIGIGVFFKNKIFCWIGRKSYGIFLWQYPVLYLFAIYGWNQAVYAPVLELALILVLTIWSDAVSELVTKFRLPRANFFFMKRIAFLLATLAGIVLFVYGGIEVAYSKDMHTDQDALRQEMAENAKKFIDGGKMQNAEAAENARQAAQARGEAALVGVTCIGDSVMLGSAGALAADLPNAAIDAKTSRYVGGGLEVAQSFAAQGRLGKVVVISLGTNGPVSGYARYEEQTVALLDYLTQEKDRHIFWVNVYGPHLKWQDTNNAYISHIPETYPSVTVVDWYSLIRQHPEWLVSDGIHPNAEGQKAYAKLIRDTIVATMGNVNQKKNPAK